MGIKIGIVGAGGNTRLRHIPGFRAIDDVEIVGVVNRTRESSEKSAQEFSIPAVFNHWQDMIDSPDIDAVCIATPAHWHAILTIGALESGKDVDCEKPVTHNVHDSGEVMNAVKNNKRVLQTGSMQRSSRGFRVACELVRNGVIGEVKRTAVNIGGPGRPCDRKTEPDAPGLDRNCPLVTSAAAASG